MSDDRIKRKILLLGDGAVGKTSLIRRYVVDKFSDDYITTIGTKVTKKDLRIESPGRTADITFMIWDVLGQRGYKNVQGGSFQGAKGTLLVYDVTRPETLRSVQEYWIPHLIEITKPIPIVLVGNKVDLCKDRATARDGLEDAMEALRINGFLSSAKTGESVEASFACLAKAILLDAESKVRGSERVEEDVANELIAVCDQIIMDSCDVMGGQEAAMPIVRQQIVKAGLDVNAPSAEGLKLTVEYLAEAESGFRNAEDVEASKLTRLGWIKAVS